MTGWPRTWALLGHKVGDNNQLLALAEALGWPFETRTLNYNLARAIPPASLGASLISLTRESRTVLAPPWPDLVMAIGRRSTPVALWIQKQNPRTKIVLVGHPRIDPDHFDLVVTTSQYPVPPRPNVLTLSLAMSRTRDPGKPTAEEQAFLESLPRPHLLFAVGGPTRYWKMDSRTVSKSLESVRKRAERVGGSVIGVSSRRTPSKVIRALAKSLTRPPHQLVTGSTPRFAFLLNDADEIFVSADSVSMMSEAIQTGRPVGLIPITMSRSGERLLANCTGDRGWGHGRRDLRRIWDQLTGAGLVGTIDEPVAGTVERDSADLAAEAVRALFGRP